MHDAVAHGDTSGMRPRLTSSHLVGRVGELAELELALRESDEERPVVVLLGGDSGVGKTRLVAEFLRRIEARPRSRSCCRATRPCRPTVSFPTRYC